MAGHNYSIVLQREICYISFRCSSWRYSFLAIFEHWPRIPSKGHLRIRHAEMHLSIVAVRINLKYHVKFWRMLTTTLQSTSLKNSDVKEGMRRQTSSRERWGPRRAREICSCVLFRCSSQPRWRPWHYQLGFHSKLVCDTRFTDSLIHGTNTTAEIE